MFSMPLLGLCLCVSSVFLVYGGLPPEEGVCKSDADCAGEECCVGLDRRRFIFSHPTAGICRPLRYQGYACHVFAIRDPSNHNLHANYCPWAGGLECRGTSIDKINSSHIIHHDPKCLPKPLCIRPCVLVYGGLPPEEGVCKSDADCAGEECCVGLDRRRFVFSHPTSGICRPLRYQGYACHVFAIRDPSNHNLHVNYCPCAGGLECRGTTIDKVNSSHIIHHDPKCLPKTL